MCMMTSSNTTHTQEPVPDTRRFETVDSMSLPHTITQTPFLYPIPGFVLKKVMENLTLPNMALAIPVLHLVLMTMPTDPGHILVGSSLVPPSLLKTFMHQHHLGSI